MDINNKLSQSKLEVVSMPPTRSAGNVCEPATIGIGFTSDWMKKWREFLSESRSVVSAKLITFRHFNENRSEKPCQVAMKSVIDSI